jgi:signal transduction histidine kinase
MNSDIPQSGAAELGGIIQRINGLGNATEAFFSRIYRSLSARSEAEKAQATARKLYQQRQKLKAAIEKRERELQRLHGILETIDEGIILQNMEGRIALINDAAKEMLGSQKALRDSEFNALLDQHKGVITLDAELAPLGEPTRIQINNRILGVTLAAVGGGDGVRIGTLLVLRDVTQEALGDRLKDQFITAISHELRTPMNALKMSSEVLANTPEDAPANRRMVQMIGRNVDVLDRMIVELLDISEMAAGSFEVRQMPVDLEALVWGVVKGMMPEIKRARLEVSVMAKDLDGLQVTGDEPRLRWALGHLLQNSIRYTETGGHIFFTMARNDNDNIAVQVVDTGVGISEKDMPHIFERFYRGEPRTTDGRLLDPRGLGQGLFVARTVIEAHGGYLSVKSTIHRGSVFTMVLPAEATASG